jgi:hypothetical protein
MLMTGVKDDETGDVNIVDAIPTALSYLFTILEEDDIMDLYKLVLETVYCGTEPVMNKFDTVYEKVSPGDDLAHFCNLAVLEKCNKLWVSRAEDGSLYGGCILNQDKPYNTVGVTFNDGLFTVNLRSVTTEELVAAEIMWKSISTGDVFTFSAETADTLKTNSKNVLKSNKRWNNSCLYKIVFQ